ncbi:putative tRNA pseudouridine synthase D, partial [Frankliniella fusca]
MKLKISGGTLNVGVAEGDGRCGRETQLGDHKEFFNSIRMWPEQFEFLHRLLSPLLVWQRTVMRQPLPSRLRLGLTLVEVFKTYTMLSVSEKAQHIKSLETLVEP